MHLAGFHHAALGQGPELRAGLHVIHFNRQGQGAVAAAAAVHIVIDIAAHQKFRAALPGQGQSARAFKGTGFGRVFQGLEGIKRKPDLPDLARKQIAEGHGIGDLLHGAQGHEKRAWAVPGRTERGHIDGGRLTAHEIVDLDLERRAEISGQGDGGTAVVRGAGATSGKSQNQGQDREQARQPGAYAPRQRFHCGFSEARRAF